MSRPKRTYKLVVIAGSVERAKAIGARHHLHPGTVLWPRSLADLVGQENVDLYVDLWSASRHPRADDMADYVAGRVRRAEQLPQGAGELAEQAS